MTIRLFERIRGKLRLLRRRKAENPLPILTWESIDRDAEAELLEQLKREAEEEIRESKKNFRNLN